MKYSRVHIAAITYELAPVVVTSEELEDRLESVYQKLNISPGQLEYLTGISERRWWQKKTPLADGAISAAQKALDSTGIDGQDIQALIYTGVCRENFEPATACRIGNAIGVHPAAAVYDISNACLGVLNGILDLANRIELGQIKAGLVVSCESAREINELTLRELSDDPSVERFTEALATFTGGSGAVAVLLTDGSTGNEKQHRLLGGGTQVDLQHHELCKWGLRSDGANRFREYMKTDSVSVLKYGVQLGIRTWDSMLKELDWTDSTVDRVICHQVGSEHQSSMLKSLNISPKKDFVTYSYLGNMGSVSLPITAAIAEDRGVLSSGDHVCFLGIGSGLNCLMLGLEW
ncbi:MAG TPA: 3-oxoacyl-ACP synthase III [Verrucomicrobiales bacterium]|nr:3-oxoacyl-ACP synthase III [Verrucomicrobiales bacterium]HIL71070.1 3-oxoacyl-ACP synthase III [Verrucomicrobiota bacterium]